MLFSKHNENITYINHYSGLLEVKGEGVLCREDTELWHESRKKWAKEYDTLSVTEGITGIGGGEYANPLPRDFYVGCTIEDFSNIFNERVRGQILSNETLKRFLEISNERRT